MGITQVALVETALTSVSTSHPVPSCLNFGFQTCTDSYPETINLKKVVLSCLYLQLELQEVIIMQHTICVCSSGCQLNGFLLFKTLGYCLCGRWLLL